MALGLGRELGITYKFRNNMWFAQQGIFTDNSYNEQSVGFGGVSLSGRWLVRPINTEDMTFHIGANFSWTHLGGGEVTNNIMKKTLTLGQPMETYVDGNEDMVSAVLPWANNVVNVGAEVLFRVPKFFARGEFLYKHLTKKRDSYSLFEDAQNNIDAWGTYEAWLGANPLRNNNFYGGYIEVGYQIFGKGYRYNNADAVLGGLDGKALEVVARWNYTGLNDVVDGEYYDVSRDQYYPDGYKADYPYNSSSVGGGNVNSFTIGVNFAFNKYVQVMADYTYNDAPSMPSLTYQVGDGSAVYYYGTENAASGGTKWEDVQPTTLDAGTYYMYAVIGETDNYKEFTTAAVQFVVEKATPDYTKPSGLTAKYGQRLGDIQLVNPEGNLAGTWSWQAPETVLEQLGTQSFDADFRPDSDNYKGLGYNKLTNVLTARQTTQPVCVQKERRENKR